MTLLASCVYGSTPAVKASIMTDALLRTVSGSMLELQNQALNQQNEVLVARAACILLCNVLAGCDANVVKVSAIMAAAIACFVCACVRLLQVVLALHAECICRPRSLECFESWSLRRPRTLIQAQCRMCCQP